MAYQFSRKGCFKCGNRRSISHFQVIRLSRLCCQLDISLKIVRLSNAYVIIVGNRGTNRLLVPLLALFLRNNAIPVVGLATYKVQFSPPIFVAIWLNSPLFHQAECPSLRVQQGGNQKCYVGDDPPNVAS
jgi:hypothetical protein